jgi:RNA polymerase sigma factor (TIGR02999 family)
MTCTINDKAPITELIVEWKKGNNTSFNELFQICYQHFKHEVRKQRLKKVSNIQQLDFCIQTTTSIVHDAYLKLSAHREQTICNRKDLYVLISQVVRSILYDQYRKATSQKRNSSNDLPPKNLEGESSELLAKLVLADKSLSKEKSRCNNVLNLRVFAALPVEEIASLLNISVRTVQNDLNFAKAWYLEELSV